MTELLARLFAPWASLYSNSTVISTAVVFLHVGGLVFGGGRAVAADVLTLRSRGVAQFVEGGRLAFLQSSHRDVLTGLGFIVVAGVSMFAADVEHYLSSPAYYAKMTAVVLLLTNGVFIKRLERPIAAGDERTPRAWTRLRAHAKISMALWFTIVLLGLTLEG